MAEQVINGVLQAIGGEAAESFGNIAQNAVDAPDQYTGLKALGYGLAKEFPAIDIFNEYPDAHPEDTKGAYKADFVKYADDSHSKIVEEIPGRKTEITNPTSEPQVSRRRTNIQHGSGSNPMPTHPPVVVTSYTSPESKSRGPTSYTGMKILNPFTNTYITITELSRLSMRNDSEGLWAKRKLRSLKNKNSKKKTLLTL